MEPPISPPVDDIIHEEALSLLELMKNQEVVWAVIDMEKIDDVGVNNRIYFNRVSIIFDVEGTMEGHTMHTITIPRTNTKEYVLEDIEKLLKQVVKELPTLRFNAFYTTFGLPPCKRSRIRFNCDSITMNYGECVCLCQEETRRKTKCGHFLCLKCHEKIKIVARKRPCPACRSDLVQNHEDDSEEE